jgi:hypothetical protein
MARFRITCIVEDKNLARVLRTLAGAAYNVEPVPLLDPGPVEQGDGGKRKGRAGRTTGANGKLTPKANVVWVKIQANGMTEFSAGDIKTLLIKEGLGPASYDYYLKQMMKARLIKKVGSGYIVQ